MKAAAPFAPEGRMIDVSEWLGRALCGRLQSGS